MIRSRSRLMVFLAGAAVVALSAIALAACGGGSSSNDASASASTTPPTPTKNTSARLPMVRVSKNPLGRILVDSQRHTLYIFKKDSGKKSACFGACAKAWPPLRANGKPTVGTGATASRVGTITRSDGKPQVTYGGHPLYRFVKDTKPGQTRGEGLTAFGGRWFALSPAAKQVSPRTKPPAPKPAPAPPKNGIPQNGGGDGDSDNFGGPDDGDGGV